MDGFDGYLDRLIDQHMADDGDCDDYTHYDPEPEDWTDNWLDPSVDSYLDDMIDRKLGGRP